MATATESVVIEEASLERGREILDRVARRWLNMSGEAFLADWREGKFIGSDDPNLDEVVIFLPFVE